MVLLGLAAGIGLILVDGSRELVWRPEDYSLNTKAIGFWVTAVAVVYATLLGGRTRVLAFAALGVLAMLVVMGPFHLLQPFRFGLTELQRIHLEPDRDLVAYRVNPNAFTREFVAVRTEQPHWTGMVLVHHLAERVADTAHLVRIDATRWSLTFVAGDRDPPHEQSIEIPAR